MVPTGAYVQQPASTGEATVGYLDIRLRYGSGGRPEHGYSWNSAPR